MTATLEVANIGARAGSTVVQFYVADDKASVFRPQQELKGFAKVWLAPGQSQRVSVTLDMRALAFFDVSRKAWVAEAGKFVLRAGFSSAEIVATAPFVLTQTWIDDNPRRALAASR